MYIENAGDFDLPLAAVQAPHSQGTIFDCSKLEPGVRERIEHAHDADVADL